MVLFILDDLYGNIIREYNSLANIYIDFILVTWKIARRKKHMFKNQ